jgi:hypothetical protein
MPIEIYRTERSNIQDPIQTKQEAIKVNKQNSKFAQHILDSQYNYNPIDQSMKILHKGKKGPKLKIWKDFTYTI